MRVGLITSRSARRIIEEVLRESGVEAVIVELPVHAIGMLKTRTIATILARRREALEAARSADVLLIPGHVEGDASEISKVVGKPVYKATVSPIYIPDIVRLLESGARLDTSRPAEEVVSLEDYTSKFKPSTAFTVGPVEIPLRPPPMVVIAEIPPSIPRGRVGRVAERLVKDGASMVAVGTAFDDTPGELGGKVAEILERVEGVPVVSEAPTLEHAYKAVEVGATGVIMSSSIALAAAKAGGIPEATFIIVSGENLASLVEAVKKLRENGYAMVAVDPSLSPPIIGLLPSLRRVEEAASTIEAPIVFSAANIIEEVQADTHSAHALLALIAAEAGASIYYVVEDSYKSYRSTAEAWEAVKYASASLALKGSRIPFSRLFVIKQPKPPSRPLRPGGKVVRVGYIEPEMDQAGYVHIQVDHERGVIMLTFYPRGGEPVTYEGVHPTSLLRALVRDHKVSLEHAGYIGFELAKAEEALTLGKTYIQDSPVIVPVWGERVGGKKC